MTERDSEPVGEAGHEAGVTPDFDPESDDVHATEDATLGGYFRVHERPPAFEGADGQPYTVSPETEKLPDLRAPWAGYLVFPKWAETGLGVIGHVETDFLARGRSESEVQRALGELSLFQVNRLLDEAIERAARVRTGADEPGTGKPGSLEDAGTTSPDSRPTDSDTGAP